MFQIVKQTHEQKMAMYMKQPKKKLAEMLIACNAAIDSQGVAIVGLGDDMVPTITTAPKYNICIKCGADVKSEGGFPLNSNYCNKCYWK